MTSDFSISNHCYDVFVEPFNQGYYNLRDAFFGTKVDAVAQNVIASAPVEKELSLCERVSSAVVGLLLIVPIINAVVYAILKIASSDLLYPTQFTVVLEPIAPVNTTTISPEEMIARKREALARLTEIEAMVRPGQQALGEINGHFEPSPHILQFNLEQLLQRYQTNHTPSKLYDFMDWAGIPNDDRRNAFTMAVDPFNRWGRADDQQTTVKDLMSNLAEYFVQQQARVGAGTPEETALKEQFTRVYDSIIDANNNCIDQLLSQLQGLVLDVIAEGDSGQGSSAQLKIINRAGLALCKYRTNLLKEILARQNPGEHHMADLERVAMQRVAEALGMQGNIFAAGARFGHMLGNVDDRVNQAVQTFIDEYKPLEHLLTDLSGYAGNHRTLRNDMLIWANGYFDIASETTETGDPAPANLPDGTPAPHMDARMSEDFDALPASEGGTLKLSAVALFLNTLGLIRQVGVPTTA